MKRSNSTDPPQTVGEAFTELREAFAKLGRELWKHWPIRIWLAIGVGIFLFFPAETPNQTCTVTRVVDGDTFHCSAAGEDLTVRLIGIDTPELPSPEGVAAKEYVEELLPSGTTVRLELDVQLLDRYRRTLAYVWLPCPAVIDHPARQSPPPSSESSCMLNEILLREGVAVLMTIPPNVKFVDRFTAATAGKDRP